MYRMELIVFLVMLFSCCQCHGNAFDNSLIEHLFHKIEALETKTDTLMKANMQLEMKVAAQQGYIDAQVRASSQITMNKDHTMKQQLKFGVERDTRRFVLAESGPIAFTARIDALYVDHVTPNQTIKFDNIVTNIGGAYNEGSGIFVAPLSGIYIFSCSLLDHQARADTSGTMLHAEIVQNQKVLGRVFAHAEGMKYRDQGAQTVFTQVTMGEQVWVRSIDNTDLKLGGDLYFTFSGYLLWPTE